MAPATQKVRPADPAGKGTTATLSAARNEFEAFQVIATGTGRGISARVTSPLTQQTDASGAPVTTPYVIEDVRLYREGIINLQRASSSDPESSAGPWPDALIPDVDELDQQRRNAFPFDIRGVSQGIWVEVFVPEGASPGKYLGTLTVSVGGSPFQTVDVELTVWDFALPSTASASSAYALAYGALPTAFHFSASDVQAFSSLRYKFGVLGLDHRISLSRHDDGLWYDLGHFAAAYGPLMDGTAPESRLTGARLTAVEYLGPPGGSSLAGDMARWSGFYDLQGWSGRLFQYTADEPNDGNGRWAQVAPGAAAAHAAVPPIRTLVTSTLPEARSHGADGLIDVLVPAINFMDATTRHADLGGTSYDAFLDGPAGESPPSPANELWLYQSCMSHDCGGSSSDGTGWPSYMIDASAVRNRAMQWLLFAYETTGELYWETGYALYAKRDAWTDQWAYTGNGDGTLFYPGTPAKIGGTSNIPVASLRLKMIREGMEDYEYLTKLASFGTTAREEALRTARALFPDPHATGRTTAQQVAEARAHLATCILAFQAGATGCP